MHESAERFAFLSNHTPFSFGLSIFPNLRQQTKMGGEICTSRLLNVSLTIEKVARVVLFF